MPNHALDLDSFAPARVWPSAAFCSSERIGEGRTDGHLAEARRIAVDQMQAVCAQDPTILYLSGGHDSRMALAASRGNTATLRAETMADGSVDPAIAARVAGVAGIPHRAVRILPTPAEERERWLWRAGRSMYDPVTELSATVRANDPGTHPVSGTGAELARASNWGAGDHEAASLGLETLLQRLRLPEHPAIREAGAAWMATLPPCDAAMILDLAKIEQIHGCWSGPEIYGNPLPVPTLNVFSNQKLNEIALSLSKEYRLRGAYYRDFMRPLWPELLDIPVNRVTGVERIRFWRHEVRRLVPTRVKRLLKPLR